MQNPKMKLICLPYAGGNKYSYKRYNNYFPKDVTLVTLDYPGHGARIQETPLTDLQQIARDAYTQIQDMLEPPYAIYGHSMGARVGYLLAKEIRQQQKPLPVQLFFTGSEAPAIRSKHADKHLLPRDAFFQALKEMGGMPDEVLQHQELLTFFEPVLRADFKAISDYNHEAAAPLDIPISVMAGNAEDITPEDLQPWQHETLHAVSTRYFEGGHFFILEQARQVVDEIVRQLDN